MAGASWCGERPRTVAALIGVAVAAGLGAVWFGAVAASADLESGRW